MMKKTVPCMLLLIGCVFSLYSLVFSSPLVTVKAESGSKEVFINGKPISIKAPVKIKDGAHIVRLKKELFTTLGVKYLEWDKENAIYVQLSRGAEKIVLEIQKGRREIKVKRNGSYVSITPVPALEYPSVFVPLEPLYELLGLSVSGAPQTVAKIPLKTKPVVETVVPVKEKEAPKTPKAPVTQPETKPDNATETVTPEKMAEPVTEGTPKEMETEEMPSSSQTHETVIAEPVEETTPSLPVTAKRENFHVTFGYSTFAPESVKFSNSGLEGRVSYAFPKLNGTSLTLSYASHNWKSVYASTGQEAEYNADIFTANVTQSLKRFLPVTNSTLNDVWLAGGFAQFSTTYEPNVTLGLSSRKQNFSGFNIGAGVQFWKVLTAEYRYYRFPERTLEFNSIKSSNAEQFTFSLMPLSF